MSALRRSSFLLITVLLLAGVVAAPASAVPSSGSSGSSVSSGSGLPWLSGSYEPTSDPAGATRFGNFRGARSDVALVYGSRSDWGVIEDPHWIFDAWRNATQTVVLSAAPWPDGGGSLLACSRGDYDAHWAAFGRNAAASGMAGRLVVRLAWEFNGDWNPWAATNPVRFQHCWRHLMTAAEQAARGSSALRWEWCVNRGVNDGLADARRAYPGDRYVDYVGMSSYDGWPPVTDAASWRGQYNATGGLRFWARFASAHHKKLALSEWGLTHQWAGHSGGDNPYYVRRMFGFFRQQRAVMGYESYFDEVDPYQGGALSLNPHGAAEYKRQVRLSRS